MSTSLLWKCCVALGRCWHSCFVFFKLPLLLFSSWPGVNLRSRAMQIVYIWCCWFCVYRLFFFFFEWKCLQPNKIWKEHQNILESSPEPLPQASSIMEAAGAVWGTTRSEAATAIGDSFHIVPQPRRARSPQPRRLRTPKQKHKQIIF